MSCMSWCAQYAEYERWRESLKKMWLDDVRPAPVGWFHVKTVEEAIDFVKNNDVDQMSLDHDLGACKECMSSFIEDQLNGFQSFDDLSFEEIQHLWLTKSKGQAMPHCHHFGSGYTFVCWLEENSKYWPLKKPWVHSANPVGRDRMQQVIDKHYGVK